MPQPDPHPTEPIIDEDLEAAQAFREIGDRMALRVIGYAFAAFILGACTGLAWVLRHLS